MSQTVPVATDTTHSQNFDDTIKVLVGPAGQEQNFTIHKDLVCASSKFFKAACSKRWAEGRAKEVRLDEVKPETFQAYVVWVYAERITANRSTQGDAKAAALDEFTEMVDLYLLGEYLDDIRLRNAAMKALITNGKLWVIQLLPNLIDHIWTSTLPDSMLRKMIVDATISRGLDPISASGFEQYSADYPKDFLRCITVASLKRLPFVGFSTFALGVNKYIEQKVQDEPESSNKFDFGQLGGSNP